MSTTRLFYARALLVKVGISPTAEREQSLVAVMVGEDSTAAWNPLDTTLELAPCTPYNSFGPGDAYHVWSYGAAETGLEATAKTMQQENMAVWLDALKVHGETSTYYARAFSRCPWGGIGDVLPIEIIADQAVGHRNYVTDRAHMIAGSGPWPYKSTGEPQG